jgi:hypothetical protein
MGTSKYKALAITFIGVEVIGIPSSLRWYTAHRIFQKPFGWLLLARLVPFNILEYRTSSPAGSSLRWSGFFVHGDTTLPDVPLFAFDWLKSEIRGYWKSRAKPQLGAD